MRRTQWVVWGVGIILTVGAWGVQGLGWALGTFVGGLLASMNLWVLARSVSRLLAGRSGSWAAVAGAKFLALLGLTYLALKHPSIDPLSFTLGLCALPLGIVFAGLFVAPPASDDEVAPAAETDHA
ncbi:MAG TPA: ATP synthase subunit I [Polyangiaceae bacterium]|nr:ATP synthase subunit I [Polyangiaceae bacterium]